AVLTPDHRGVRGGPAGPRGGRPSRARRGRDHPGCPGAGALVHHLRGRGVVRGPVVRGSRTVTAVVITGGTSGVGLACAHRFAAGDDARIVLVGGNAERGEKACAAVRSSAPAATVHFVAADANDPAQATAAA